MAVGGGRGAFGRPGFVVAAVVVAVIAVVAVVLGVVNVVRGAGGSPDAGGSGAASAGSSASSSVASAPAQASGGGSSVCGLEGEVLEGRLVIAPEAEWQYQGTMAYPTSSEFGPGATDPAGFRYCFQRSPEGALFAAANALATATDQTLVPAWIDYFASEGAKRDELVSSGGEGGSSSDSTGTRLRIVGFRLLMYNGDTARVDLAVHGSTPRGPVTLSMVYELVWEDGDWRMNTDAEAPVDVASIPDTAGYVAFGE